MKLSFHSAPSTRYAAVALIIIVGSALQACSSDTIPTAPQSVSRYPLEPASVQLRVFGTVTDDDGVPVSGVIVRIYRGYPSGPMSSAVTDDEGFYRISFLSGEGMSAFTVKEGFLSAWQFHQMASGSDLRWDLPIHRLPIRTDGK